MGLSYEEMRSVLLDLATGGADHGYRVATMADSDDYWMATWAHDALYALVVASPATVPGRSLIDIHAGGAYGATACEQLFRTLTTATGRFDFGGPWARVLPGDGVSYGWRTRLPSDLFTQSNLGDAFGFVLGMIDAFGAAAETLAEELMPSCGGRRILDTDPKGWPSLLSGVLPQDEIPRL